MLAVLERALLMLAERDAEPFGDPSAKVGASIERKQAHLLHDRTHHAAKPDTSLSWPAPGREC